MSFHPDPVAVAVHVEHHRQELMAQAHRYRLAKDGGVDEFAAFRARLCGLKSAIVAGIQSLAARWRPRLDESIEFPIARDLQG